MTEELVPHGITIGNHILNLFHFLTLANNFFMNKFVAEMHLLMMIPNIVRILYICVSNSSITRSFMAFL